MERCLSAGSNAFLPSAPPNPLENAHAQRATYFWSSPRSAGDVCTPLRRSRDPWRVNLNREVEKKQRSLSGSAFGGAEGSRLRQAFERPSGASIHNSTETSSFVQFPHGRRLLEARGRFPLGLSRAVLAEENWGQKRCRLGICKSWSS